jgi:glycosyltransferase involved in cell wall biosynthesis
MSFMKLLMHVNSITERGTTSAILEYASGLQQHGILPVISWQSTHSTNNAQFVGHVVANFETCPYSDFAEIRDKSNDFDGAYFLKGGENDQKLLDIERNLVHVVFQNYEPHGSKYFYVSQWLAEQVYSSSKYSEISGPLEFLPHIVDLPQASQSMRGQLGIPKTATVGIRIGGYDTFDIKFAQNAVKYLLRINRNLFFVFVNTKRFTKHPRAIFLDPVLDKQLKSNYLQSADFFLHARSQGESFGIAILEAMSLGVPVLAWDGGLDLNHTKLLGVDSLYSNFLELTLKIQNIVNYNDVSRNLKVALEYTPETVIKKFLTFLDS